MSIIIDSIDVAVTLVAIGMPFAKVFKVISIPAKLVAKGGSVGKTLAKASLNALRELADFAVPVFTAADILKGSGLALRSASRWAATQAIKHYSPATRSIDLLNKNWGGVHTKMFDDVTLESIQIRCTRVVKAKCNTELRSNSPELIKHLVQDSNLSANDYFRNLRESTLAKQTEHNKQFLNKVQGQEVTVDQKIDAEIQLMQQTIEDHHAFKDDII